MDDFGSPVFLLLLLRCSIHSIAEKGERERERRGMEWDGEKEKEEGVMLLLLRQRKG